MLETVDRHMPIAPARAYSMKALWFRGFQKLKTSFFYATEELSEITKKKKRNTMMKLKWNIRKQSKVELAGFKDMNK